MKVLGAVIAIAALAFTAAAGRAVAQPSVGPYVSLGAGVDFLQDEVVKPYGSFGPSARDFSFDSGPAGDAAMGFGFGNGLRLEIEGDYAYSRLSGVKFPDGGPGAVAGHEAQFGGFANLAYDFDLGLPVFPFLGLGAGYQALQLNGASSGPDGFRVSGQGSTTEGAFAYQGMAGLSYPVMAIPGLSLTAEYRLTGVITSPPYPRSVLLPDGTERPGLATLSNVFNHEALIGLRYSFGAPPAPPPQPPPSSATLPPGPPATRTYLVFFDWDRADLTERARQIVAEAAAASAKVPVTRIDVNGYTDLSGSADYNQHLSMRRAESVEAELVRDGVPKQEIVIKGFGDTNPLVATAPGVREPQNRRVEIILH